MNFKKIDRNEKNKKDFFNGFLSRFKDWRFVTIYGIMLIISIILLLQMMVGSTTEYYVSLKKRNINIWIERSAWIISYILTYVSLILIWYLKEKDDIRDLKINLLFLISGFLFIGWATTTYFIKSFKLQFWICIIMLIFNIYIAIYIYKIYYISGILIIPMIILYIYLLYTCIDMAHLNGEKIF